MTQLFWLFLQPFASFYLAGNTVTTLSVPSATSLWTMMATFRFRAMFTATRNALKIIFPLRVTTNIEKRDVGTVVKVPLFLSRSLRTLAGYSSAKQDTDKQKKEFVLLMDTDNKILGTRTKEEALSFAKKHDLRLVRLDEAQHAEAKKRPVYQLVNPKAMILEDEETADRQNKHKHAVKNVIVSASISDNDLQVKLKSIKKWLEKPCEIRVGVTGTAGAEKQLEGIYDKFVQACEGEARFLQKRIKGGILKFSVVPQKSTDTSKKKQEM